MDKNNIFNKLKIKFAKDLSILYNKEVIQIVNKYMKKFNIPAIREIKI